MIPQARQEYNNHFTVERYQEFLRYIGERYNFVPAFKICETPVFVDQSLKRKLFEACESITDFLVLPDFKSYSEPALVPEFTVPNESDHTLFLQMDFGVCKNGNGDLHPYLIEVQGFPSLYFYQDFVAEAYQRFFRIPDGYSHLFNGMTPESYRSLLRQVIVGDCRPEEVVILEVDPLRQPTAIDFVIAKALLGVEILCISEVKRSGRELYYIDGGGRKIGIRRIFNRVIFDELVQRPELLEGEFSMTEEIDAEWIGHPNWFYRISKHTLPLLKSPYVPESYILGDLDRIPDDLENYVLKPLFSFSGSGVKINIDRADVEAVEDPYNFMLQRKVTYEPVIKTPGVPAKCEIRMLMIWEPGQSRPRIINNLARLSKGEMIGVKYNRGLDWVGGSVGFFE